MFIACNMITDCYSCQNADLTGFTCYWCDRLNRCSDVLDRNRQEWLVSRCPYQVPMYG